MAGWPRAIAAKRAESLGIRADANMDEIVQAFVEDDLAAQKAMAAAGSATTSRRVAGRGLAR